MDSATVPGIGGNGTPAVRGRWRGWAISAGVHLASIGMLAMAVGISRAPEQDALVGGGGPPFITPPAAMPPRVPPPDVPHEQVTIDTQEQTDMTVISNAPDASLVAPLSPDDQQATPAEAPDHTPSPDADGAASFMMAAIGAGDGGGQPTGLGPRGKPYGPPGVPSQPSYRPPPSVLSAIDRSLRWFARHQGAAGQWQVDGYQRNCMAGGAQCEPGTANTGPDGDLACTGIALLCFLGHGHDGVAPSVHRAVVRRGVSWLVARQHDDGSFGTRNYEHAIAVMVLGELIAMQPEAYRQLRAPAQRAVEVLLARQNPGAERGHRSGWDYHGPNPRRDDSSVTGWNILALKDAHLAGLDTGNGLADGRRWLEDSWRAANPAAATLTSRDASGFPYTFDPTIGTSERTHLAGLGAACAAFLGHQRGDVLIESLTNRIVADDLPALSTWPCNTYLLYYDTMAMFQVTSDLHDRDPRWASWHRPIEGMLTRAQRLDDGCFAGSWDFQGTRFAGHETGRLLSTGLNTLSLEVFERFAVVTRPGAPHL